MFVEGQQLLGERLVLLQVQLAGPAAGVGDPNRSSSPATATSPSDGSPNVSIRLKTEVGLAPLQAGDQLRLRSPWTPRIDGVCPALRSASATWSTTTSYSFALALQIGQDRDLHRATSPRRTTALMEAAWHAHCKPRCRPRYVGCHRTTGAARQTRRRATRETDRRPIPPSHRHVVPADPRPRPDDRGLAARADPRRVRDELRGAWASGGSGPASTSRPSGACPTGPSRSRIPFYLARPDLTALHAERIGHVEGVGRADILRYLRHEMGHVVNYAYRLYETAGVDRALRLDRRSPTVEEYRPEPFSRRFVRHLPGWYAQKHPDEDWAETFAVWMTPGLDWRAEYADWPEALAKLEYCDRTMAALADRDPLVTADDLDEDVGELADSVDEYYSPDAGPDPTVPARPRRRAATIFEAAPEPASTQRRPAAEA